MQKFKNLIKVTKKDIPSLAMIAGGSLMLSIALQRSGARNVLDYISKHGLKVVNEHGEEIQMGLKPLIHLD